MPTVLLTNKNQINLLLGVLIFIETICYTYLEQTQLYFTVSVLYFIAGFGICFLPLTIPLSHRVKGRQSYLIPLTGIIFLGGIIAYFIPEQFHKASIDYHLADMLPRIKIYAQRFLDGKYVYDNVPEIWGGGLPPYFPAVWAPFIPAIIFKYDLRWTCVVMFLIALFLLLRLIKLDQGKLIQLPLAILFVGLFLLNNFQIHNGNFWTMTYEGEIAFYYTLLCVAIISWNPFIIGTAISLCLLSRFSLSFWVPVFLIFLWIKAGFQFAAKTSITLGLIILFLLVIPFVTGHLDTFSQVINQYTRGSEDYWTKNQIEFHGLNEVGLFKFFSVAQIPLLRKIQITTTLLAPCFFVILSLQYFRSFEGNEILIGLCSLKFTLLFFYNFIEIPFHYLFITPAVISYAVGFYYLSLPQKRQFNSPPDNYSPTPGSASTRAIGLTISSIALSGTYFYSDDIASIVYNHITGQ